MIDDDHEAIVNVNFQQLRDMNAISKDEEVMMLILLIETKKINSNNLLIK